MIEIDMFPAKPRLSSSDSSVEIEHKRGEQGAVAAVADFTIWLETGDGSKVARMQHKECLKGILSGARSTAMKRRTGGLFTCLIKGLEKG